MPIFDLNILKIIRGVYLNILLKTELLGRYGYSYKKLKKDVLDDY